MSDTITLADARTVIGVMIFAGGIPLQHNGMIIGGIGVSGGDGQQNQTSPRPEPVPSRHQAR